MSLELEIRVPDEAVLQTRISALTAADETGRFGLLPNHQTFATLLTPCVLGWRGEDGRERFAAVDGGVLLMKDEKISIVTREAVVADRLDDVTNSVESMLSARRAQEAAAQTEFAGLRARLLRELSSVETRT